MVVYVPDTIPPSLQNRSFDPLTHRPSQTPAVSSTLSLRVYQKHLTPCFGYHCHTAAYVGVEVGAAWSVFVSPSCVSMSVSPEVVGRLSSSSLILRPCRKFARPPKPPFPAVGVRSKSNLSLKRCILFVVSQCDRRVSSSLASESRAWLFRTSAPDALLLSLSLRFRMGGGIATCRLVISIRCRCTLADSRLAAIVINA